VIERGTQRKACTLLAAVTTTSYYQAATRSKLISSWRPGKAGDLEDAAGAEIQAGASSRQ